MNTTCSKSRFSCSFLSYMWRDVTSRDFPKQTISGLSPATKISRDFPQETNNIGTSPQETNHIGIF